MASRLSFSLVISDILDLLISNPSLTANTHQDKASKRSGLEVLFAAEVCFEGL